MAVNQKKFSDLDLSFTPHPDTGDLIPLRGDRAVARSIRQIVMTNFYEKLNNPRFGGNIASQLFELWTPQTEHTIRTTIKEALNLYEPRIELNNVIVAFPNTAIDADQNTIRITIEFNILGEAQNKQVTFSLKRVR
jgi:phage baseplate assembly protein W